MKFVFTFTALCLLVSSHLADGVQQRIIGGTAAAQGDFPFVVSLQVDGFHVCSGMIYSESWIVTAASCVYGLSASRIKVAAGGVSNTLEEPGEVTVPVFSTLIFDGFNNDSKLHDIALLELAGALTFDANINYVRYDEPETGEATVMGWGYTLPGGPDTTKLQSVTVTVPPPTVNCTGYSSAQFNANYMLCVGAAEDVGFACNKDEGSPLIQTSGAEPIAIGLYSRSNVTCAAPAVFTRIVSYYPWLVKEAGAQPPPAKHQRN